MGKLKGSVFYLCGPIDYAKDLGIGWRQEITPRLREMGTFVIDPTNKPTAEKELFEGVENQGLRRALKENGEFEKLHELGQSVRNFDLRSCDKADGLIVYLDYDVVMTGTLEELFIANKSKKPILVFCKQGKKSIADWIYFTIPPKYIFENMDEIISYLHKVNSGEEGDNRRWHFFDWEKIVCGQ